MKNETLSRSPSSNTMQNNQASKKSSFSLSRKEGFLTKKSGKLFYKKVQLLWFELDPFTDFVTYYTKPPALGVVRSKLVGAFNLEGAKIDGTFTDEPKITVKTKSGKSHSLLASTFTERDLWRDAMIQVQQFSLSSTQIAEEWNNSNSEVKDFLAGDPTQLLDSVEDTVEEEDSEEATEVPQVEEPEKENLDEFFSLTVEDKDGKPVALKDILGKNTPTLLVLLRHFGCMLCRQQAGMLLRRKMDFYELGVPIIAIGQGTPAMARSFAKEFEFPGKLFTDQKKSVYKALSCRRGVKYNMTSKTLGLVKKAYAEGYRQGPSTGDVFQLGGLFILSQNSGFIYQHIDQFAGDSADLSEVLGVCEKYLRENPYEQWSNKVPIKKEWTEVTATLATDDPARKLLLPTPNYSIETGRNDVPYATTKVLIEESERDFTYYSENFYGKEHTNYYGDLATEEERKAAEKELSAFDKADSYINPFILSVEKAGNSDAKAILRTKEGDIRFFIPIHHSSSEKDILQYIKNNKPELAQVKINKFPNKIQVADELTKLENKLISKTYKFGVLYAKENQTENDMYANVETSKEYEEFLEFLGERVSMLGFEKYRGGLDNTKNFTGEYSVYTGFRDFEIMFHVSTLLPYNPETEQQIDRKKHLGNDVVMIIFKEGDDPIDMTGIKSQFNHVFCIVQVDKAKTASSGQTHYRMAFGNKPGVQPFGPYLPFPAVFKKCDLFRDFLLTKLINGERAAMYAPHFRNRIRTRRSFLNDIITKSYSSPSSSMRDKPKRRPAIGVRNSKDVDETESFVAAAVAKTVNNNNNQSNDKRDSHAARLTISEGDIPRLRSNTTGNRSVSWQMGSTSVAKQMPASESIENSTSLVAPLKTSESASKGYSSMTLPIRGSTFSSVTKKGPPPPIPTLTFRPPSSDDIVRQRGDTDPIVNNNNKDEYGGADHRSLSSSGEGQLSIGEDQMTSLLQLLNAASPQLSPSSSGSSTSSSSGSRRVTIRPFYSSSFDSVVIRLPETMEELISTASSVLGIEAKRVRLFPSGGLVADIDVVRDNDVLCFTTQEDEANIKKGSIA